MVNNPLIRPAISWVGVHWGCNITTNKTHGSAVIPPSLFTFRIPGDFRCWSLACGDSSFLPCLLLLNSLNKKNERDTRRTCWPQKSHLQQNWWHSQRYHGPLLILDGEKTFTTPSWRWKFQNLTFQTKIRQSTQGLLQKTSQAGLKKIRVILTIYWEKVTGYDVFQLCIYFSEVVL